VDVELQKSEEAEEEAGPSKNWEAGEVVEKLRVEMDLVMLEDVKTEEDA